MVAARRALNRDGGVRVHDVDTECLSGVTLELVPGERVALLGRNGAGKTTLLRLCAGLAHPRRGEVEVTGRIGYVPQNVAASLLPWFRVRANITLSRVAALDEALAVVPAVAPLLDRWPHELSGGEQQLVSIARALAGDPRVLLLDEPFSALDASARPALRQSLLAWIAKRGATLILVTHDHADVGALAQGVLRLEGTPARLWGSLR